MGDVAIRVRGLGKQYQIGAARDKSDGLRHAIEGSFRRLGQRLRGRADAAQASHEDFWALKDVSFEVKRGECVGVIGRNGAGKSTLLKILSRITEPTVGEVRLRGRVGSLLEVGTGFHPELTGRENIYLNGSVLGMSRREVKAKFDEIVAFSEVEKFLDTPVKRYSSGMYVRLAFAVAAHLEPEILIVDEVLAVGDAQFQQKCISRMQGVADEGRTVLVVSHNLSVVRSLCTYAIQLEFGCVVGHGTVDDQVTLYLQRMAHAAKAELATRSDREGNGELRVLRFVVTDQSGRPEGELYAGDPWGVELDYAGQSDGRLGAAISVWSGDGTKVFHVDTDMRGTDLGPAAGGRIGCQFPRLPLAPGQYYCNVLLTAGGEMADHIYRAADFTVLPGDYFGIGRPASGGGGYVLVDHRWEVPEL